RGKRAKGDEVQPHRGPVGAREVGGESEERKGIDHGGATGPSRTAGRRRPRRARSVARPCFPWVGSQVMPDRLSGSGRAEFPHAPDGPPPPSSGEFRQGRKAKHEGSQEGARRSDSGRLAGLSSYRTAV